MLLNGKMYLFCDMLLCDKTQISLCLIFAGQDSHLNNLVKSCQVMALSMGPSAQRCILSKWFIDERYG